MGQQLRFAVAGKREDLLRAGGPQLLAAAVDEALAELDAQEEQVREEDERRSTKLGETVTSTAVFARIARMREQLSDARLWRSANMAQAISGVNSLLR